ncbi:hypothetical protein ACNKHS_23985 [Shigella flexneri]
MEFIAIRRNMGRERIRSEVLRYQHPVRLWRSPAGEHHGGIRA